LNLLLKLFIDICRLRAKPQDVPASSALLLLTIVLALVSGILAISGSVYGFMQTAIISLMDVAVTLILLSLILKLMNLSSRLLQTATAIFGTGAIINLLSLPVMLLMNSGAENPGYQLLGALLYFALLIWGLTVMAHILRHSFQLPLTGGLLIAIGYFLLINTLIQTFFPAGQI
jgi:peptidoglycan/LPS O-acetylase OafA/YrhL